MFLKILLQIQFLLLGLLLSMPFLLTGKYFLIGLVGAYFVGTSIANLHYIGESYGKRS